MKRLALLMMFAATLFSVILVQAQESYSEQDAINLAASSDVFAAGLDENPGWSAAAYDTHNAYGIWRVQFWYSGGDEIGWADVSPERGRVYSWETYFGATDAQQNAAEPVLRDFINNDETFIDLLEDPSQYEMYIDYDGYNDFWGVYIERGTDSIWSAVQFDGKTPDSLDNPRLLGLYFSGVLSYNEWQESNKATAIATAFQNTDVADALASVDKWTTSVELNDDGSWTVHFLNGDTVLASVQVDINTEEVVDYSLGE